MQTDRNEGDRYRYYMNLDLPILIEICIRRKILIDDNEYIITFYDLKMTDKLRKLIVSKLIIQDRKLLYTYSRL